MLALETTRQLNTEHVIRAILDRAEREGTSVTRDQVLEDLRWDDQEDVTQWTETVDRLMFERLDEDVS
jgi:hypothetical protein